MNTLKAICIAAISSAWTAAAAANCLDGASITTSSANDLIDRTDRIVIAKVAPLPSINQRENNSGVGPKIDLEKERTKATQGQNGGDRAISPLGITKLVVLQNIKGAGADTIFVASDPNTPHSENNFNHHRSKEFWSDDMIGRAKLQENCKISVSFSAGLSYLIFVGPPHVKAYEIISDDNDRWLAYVRNRNNNTNPSTSTPNEM